jgi:hypothetical protein
MSFVVVADLETPHEALLVRGLLRAHGIPAETTADSHVFPGTVTGRVSGTGVVVPAADAEDARALLDATGPGPDPGSAGPGPPPGHASPGPAHPEPVSAGPESPGGASSGPAGSGSASHGPPPLVANAARPRWAVIAIVGLIALVVWLLMELAGAL